MMTFLWVYAYNLRLPISIAVVVGLVMLGVVAYHSRKTALRTQFAQPDNTDAKVRLMGCAQLSMILVGIWVLVAAIPAPDYNVVYRDRVRTVERKVPVVKYTATRVITKAPIYSQVYAKCIDSYSSHAGDDELKICHQSAIEASRPPQTVRVKLVHDSYKTLFDSCNESYAINKDDRTPTLTPAMIRNQRMEVCRNVALTGSR
jgi:hypothetical protein